MVRQLSLFLENKSGRLAEATRIIGDAGVNIRALAVADTSDFGVLRFIADDTDKAMIALRAAGFTVADTAVIAAEAPDKPGSLAMILESLGADGINVEYMYAFFRKTHENAVIILRVEDNEITIKSLQKAGVKILSAKEVYEI